MARRANFKKGDTISNAEIFGDEMYKGTLIGKRGYIPENYLKLRTSSLSPDLLSTLEFEVFQNYTSKTPDQLTIQKGEAIGNVQTALDGWNIGTLLKEPKLFPANFVKLNVEKPSEKAFQDMEFEVLFDYTAKNSEELTLTKGSIIKNVRYVMKGWNKGTLKEQCGMIPGSNVKISIDKVSAKFLSVLEFVVIRNYTSAKPDELTIRKGDIIRRALKVCDGWNGGTLNGKTGIFPDDFVKIRNPTMQDLSGIELIVTSDYTPRGTKETDYLTIRKGDTIINVQAFNDGSYWGTKIGRTGMFPDNFVKISNPFPELLQNKEFIVTSDYTCFDAEQMSIEKGDIIRYAEYIGDGWYKGSKLGETGIFPNNFVTLCSSKISSSILMTFEFEAPSSFRSKTSENLTLAVGDVVRNVEYSSNGWLRGSTNDKTGIFPSICVEVVRNTNEVPSISNENLTQHMQQMSVRERDIPKELLCPVCLELPEKEIYQCTNGHGVCGACIKDILACPLCRISLKVDGRLIRNRIAESLVCTFKARSS